MENKYLETFSIHKNHLLGISYRILGSLAEAEEIVQEVYIKWQSQDIDQIKNFESWLVKVCTNQSIDKLRSAYKQREVYIGPWLPEPVLNSFASWIEDPTELDESISQAFLLILEKLSPKERAVYILREVFSYSFNEISSITNLSPENCRKIAERARKYIHQNKPRFRTPLPEDEILLKKFFATIKSGEIEDIKGHFNQNIEFWSDGGGKVSASRKVLMDQTVIAKFLSSIYKAKEESNFKMEFTKVNNKIGLLVSKLNTELLWELESVFSFEFNDDKISRIFVTRNPDKLQMY